MQIKKNIFYICPYVKKAKNNIAISAENKHFNAFLKVMKRLFFSIEVIDFYPDEDTNNELEIVYANIRV